MTLAEFTGSGISELAQRLHARHEPFAVATVIHTSGSTSAKPGAKAILDANGTILQGWIGGGCIRSAAARAVARAQESGHPQRISLHPQEVLDEEGISEGDVVKGVRFARSGCPSQGSVELFVEIVQPRPELVIYGESPVAHALARLAATLGWSVAKPDPETAASVLPCGHVRMVVVATQGNGDITALRAALALEAQFVAFVASRRKFSSLARELASEGIPEEAISAVQSPAGIPIAAVTSDEIALSILAQLTHERRRRQQVGGGTED